MSWEAWFTLAVVAGTVLALARELLSPATAVFGAMVAVLVAGVVSPAEALAGFSNPAPFTVAALYILARAVEKTGALQPIVAGLMGEARGERFTLTRLLLPTAAASAFLNNTPIVAMLAPQIQDWADRNQRSPSRYLMPLSFATILGGVSTLIGTSTNLVVSGLLEEEGMAPLGLFELTMVGLPVALLGLAAIIYLAPRVLPDRRSPRRELAEEARSFVVDMEVEPGGPLEGTTVRTARLRHLQGVFLVQIDRDGELIGPVGPETILQGSDRLRFVGRSDQVVDLHQTRGLRSTERSQLEAFDTSRATFFEVVIGSSSPLVGQTLREGEFRSTYQGAVVAIHRAGQLVDEKLGEVPLRVGDTLIVLADPAFRDRWYDRPDFLLVSRLGGGMPPGSTKAGLVGLVGLAIVVLAGVGWLPILQAALLGAVALVLFGVLSANEARGAVSLDVIVIIASSFGLAAAMETSGLAGVLASGLIDLVGSFGEVGVLLGLVLATVALTEAITNNAAAVLLFPVALSAAGSVGADPRGFAIAVAVAASASFLTPIGYQTNTMVYGPGGYRFGDYARLGFPLTLIVIAAVVFLVPLLWS
jgi:di/tricarboxylate transporter